MTINTGILSGVFGFSLIHGLIIQVVMFFIVLDMREKASVTSKCGRETACGIARWLIGTGDPKGEAPECAELSTCGRGARSNGSHGSATLNAVGQSRNTILEHAHRDPSSAVVS